MTRVRLPAPALPGAGPTDRPPAPEAPTAHPPLPEAPAPPIAHPRAPSLMDRLTRGARSAPVLAGLLGMELVLGGCAGVPAAARASPPCRAGRWWRPR